jgi:Alcohol dehydrogenase transcription factor Myb/SANT-like.
MKWNTNNILLFLQVYQQYPTLWNIKDKDYSKKSLRDASFKGVMSELKENQLLGEMDPKLLKSKIRSIRDVNRTELQKIA